ncbi:citrate synthase [Conidiobolus coronatus NRRL 28638]|uniref:Citrate synthase n=1 Tax=Conidiobolus coronatus (strain ATCC 28846 / CBS 209.66 / NRRL 28638) TaxID=796925 RepID=A0A137PBC5_CONC2|nr:citrate synthase [Conidiobolus coronatus NRRL 28638]|eukprot:KXN72308.1 citrate synthase [Conidiobolus coronatus NRRL 28638]
MSSTPKQRLDNLISHLSLSENKTFAKQKSNLVVVDKDTGKTWELEHTTETGKSTNLNLFVSGETEQALTILDNRTKKVYEIPIKDGTISASALKAIKNQKSDTDGLRVYDPGFINTAVCESSITYIDGDKGILHYRGYPIEELAEKSSFLEVAYLLIYGDLPTAEQFEYFHKEVLEHTILHTNVTKLMGSFNYDAHPMGMFISGISALSTFVPDANPSLKGSDLYAVNPEAMDKQIIRILGKVITMASLAYRHRIGRPYNLPLNKLGYTENFLYMMDHMAEPNYRPNPKLVKALDILFILHADHELNCSTAAMRHIGSSRVDPYSAIAGAASALYGPLHGGANEAVLRMLEDIGSVEAIPTFLQQVKNRQKKLMGFGHRVYKNYDPRAKLIRKTAYEVFEVCGREPLIDVAIALEQAALNDDFFAKRKLYPNVDFYSGLIYKAMGFPTDFFPVLFAIPRVAGWLAHWKESYAAKDGKIWRPRQVYVGHGKRPYLPIDLRNNENVKAQSVSKMPAYSTRKRSSVAIIGDKPENSKL